MAAMVVHQGALGDWVLAFPVLRALAAEHGCVLAASALEKAKLAARVVEGVEPVDGQDRNFSLLYAADGAEGISPEWRRRFDTVRLVVSFVSTGQDAWARNVRAALPEAQKLFVQPRPPEAWEGHVCQWQSRQLQEQGWKPDGSIALPCARDNARGPVVIHPGSGGRAKCWPAPRFEQLAIRLRQQGLGVRVLLGEVEQETWPAQMLNEWQSEFQAKTLSSLAELHDAIADARLFIGNDSGPTHLAAQMGLRTLALFGPTSARRWGPRGPQVMVLNPPDGQLQAMTWLEVELAVDCAQQLLATHAP